jgi:hypothetical protein
MYQRSTRLNNVLFLSRALRDFISFQQPEGMSTHAYYKKFESLVEVAEQAGAEIGTETTGMLAYQASDPTMTHEQARKKAQDEFPAMELISSVDPK